MGTPEHLTHLLSNLHEGQEAIVRTGHGTIGLIPNWERSMALYCHPAYLAFKQSESERHSVMSDSLQPHGLYSPLNSPGQNTRVGSLSLLQVIFSTQESNQDLLHCRRILYQLSYQRRQKQFNTHTYAIMGHFLLPDVGRSQQMLTR